MTNEIQYIPDSLFPTDNDFEVSSLRLDMAASTCEIPFVCFGEQKRTFKMNGTGTLHFPYKFSSTREKDICYFYCIYSKNSSDSYWIEM